MTKKELKEIIKQIHHIWYEHENWTTNPVIALRMHNLMCYLWDYADITSSLIENNPNEVTVEQYKQMTGLK